MRKLALLVGIAACHQPAATTVAAPTPTPAVAVSAPVAISPAPTPVDKHECSPKLTKLTTLAEIRAEVEREHCDGDAFQPASNASALMLAVERGDADLVAYLISVGADVNYYPPESDLGNEGEMALWLAAKEGRADLVELLLDAGADVASGPPGGADLLELASLNDSVEIAKLVIAHHFDPATSNVMTYHGGPGADLFVYLAGLGVPTDGRSADEIDSLRWEAAHEPNADARAEDWVEFWADVIGKTRSARARDLAIKHLLQRGPSASPAVPALIAVVLGKDLSDGDWSRADAGPALEAIGWTADLDAALPKLLAAVPKLTGQAQVSLMYLLADAAPVSRRLADTLLVAMRRGTETSVAAMALGRMLARGGVDRATEKRVTAALERAAKSKDTSLAAGAEQALQALRSRSQT